MPTDCISYQNSGILLMNDYLDQKTIYTLYITASPLEILKDKSLKKQYDDSNRVALVSVLQKQYAIETSHLTQQNIEALKNNQYIYRY
jgi:hypothetical protein